MNVPAITQRPGKGIYTLWAPYTLCYFNTLNNSYKIYIGHQSIQACAADLCLNYVIAPKRQLVTWKIHNPAERLLNLLRPSICKNEKSLEPCNTRIRGGGGLIILWIYKEKNKLRDWKNVFTYSPWAPHTYDFAILTSLTRPRKILLVVLQIAK
jgi:hypothetical protein